MKIKTIIFDLDDTLIETGVIFREVLDNLARRVRERLGASAPAAEIIMKRQEEIDLGLLAAAGVTPARFGRSFVLAYREFLGEAARPEDEAYLENEGTRAFHDLPALSPGVPELLKALRDREKIIYTLGFPEVQLPRLRGLGLEPHFVAIYCVAEKRQDVLAGILGDRDRAATLVVGDSLRGEVAPAVELGCHAVLLERPHAWTYHQAEVKGPYHRLQRISDLVELIRRIEE